MRRYPPFIDTRHNRYKIAYAVRRPFDLSTVDGFSEWTENRDQAIEWLRGLREIGYPSLELYELNLTGEFKIHWIRLMDSSEYGSES